MKTKDFIEKVVRPRLNMCINLLGAVKDLEYTRNGDKFHNFKRTAQIRNISIVEAWDGMQNKHLTSFLDMISDVKAGKLPSQKLLDDKVTDMINYILLFEGIVMEIKDQVHNPNAIVSSIEITDMMKSTVLEFNGKEG